MKKRKNKNKKSLTAMSAVVAAGLTPGIALVSAAAQQPRLDVEYTAADMVSINGEVMDFDELFDMQLGDDGDTTQSKNQQEKAIRNSISRANKSHQKVYGPPPPIKGKKKDKKKDGKQDKIDQETRDRQIADSIVQANEKRQALVYGPPPVNIEELKARHDAEVREREELMERALLQQAYRTAQSGDKEGAIEQIQFILMDYCASLINAEAKGIPISPESHFIEDLKMDDSQLELLKQKVEDRFDLILANNELEQLTSPSRLARYIIETAMSRQQQ